MTQVLVISSVLFPLVLSFGFVLEALRPWLPRVLPIAALPGLWLALTGTTDTVSMPWLLEGALWGIDDMRRVFLAFTCLIWTVAGMFAQFYFQSPERNAHFALFWLLALTGNVGLIIAQDIAGFYTLFSLMTLTSFGLVAHWRNPHALHAGSVYVAMALLGEMALLAGLVMAAAPDRLLLLADVPGAVVASPYRDWIIALLIGGFGVKAGFIGLHLWMPMAYSAAPGPSSAVLAGAMLNAGLFGWLHTLPIGLVALPVWSTLLIAAGLLAAFGAAIPGVCARDPKAVLAWSSISQMGLITALVGVGFAAPASWDLGAAALVVYAMHHGLAKSALFMGQGTAIYAGKLPAALFWTLNALPGLALTGLVFTSGAAAKSAFKYALAAGSGPPWLETLISLAAVATTLLIARFLWCLHPLRGREVNDAGLTITWTVGVACSLLLFWWLPLPAALSSGLSTGLAAPVDFLWPPVVGMLLAVAAWKMGLRAPSTPPGDLLALLEKLFRQAQRHVDASGAALGHWETALVVGTRLRGKHMLMALTRLLAAEQGLRAYAGLAFALLFVLIVALLLPV